jgi:hypothetical protein
MPNSDAKRLKWWLSTASNHLYLLSQHYEISVFFFGTLGKFPVHEWQTGQTHGYNLQISASSFDKEGATWKL